jgi:hypothetical protein
MTDGPFIFFDDNVQNYWPTTSFCSARVWRAIGQLDEQDGCCSKHKCGREIKK